MLTKDELAEIRKRAEAASLPEWEVQTDMTDGGEFRWAMGPWHDQRDGDTDFALKDAEFIAHARTDIPRLLEHIAELEAESAKLRAIAEWVVVHDTGRTRISLKWQWLGRPTGDLRLEIGVDPPSGFGQNAQHGNPPRYLDRRKRFTVWACGLRWVDLARTL